MPLKIKKPSRDKNKRSQDKRLDEERRRLGAQDEIEAAIAGSAVRAKKMKARRRWFWRGLGGLGALLLIWLGYYLFTPYKGSMAYGVCKIFLEQNVQYPEYLRLSQVEEFSNWVRIWYTRVDAFGAERMEAIQCYYRFDKALGLHLMERVTMDRREVDPAIVARFNKTLPLIFANPPDLALPRPLPDTLKNLRFDVNKYIRPIL